MQPGLSCILAEPLSVPGVSCCSDRGDAPKDPANAGGSQAQHQTRTGFPACECSGSKGRPLGLRASRIRLHKQPLLGKVWCLVLL